MAYQKGKGCQPITSKIKYTTKGGMVTQPILNMGAPVKMKMSSPAKGLNDGDTGKRGENGLGTIGGNYAANNAMQAIPSDDLSMTPYSKKDGKGVIHGPKVSYDMAYEKAKKTKRYANMSKADYIKEAKRQTKSFTETGNWDAKPKRKKATATSTIKSKGIQPLSKEIKIETKVDASAVKPKGKKVEPTKKQARKTKSIDKKLTKAQAARDAGNIKKAERKERAAKRKAARVARKASPAKQTNTGIFAKGIPDKDIKRGRGAFGGIIGPSQGIGNQRGGSKYSFLDANKDGDHAFNDSNNDGNVVTRTLGTFKPKKKKKSKKGA